MELSRSSGDLCDLLAGARKSGNLEARQLFENSLVLLGQLLEVGVGCHRIAKPACGQKILRGLL